MSVGTGAGQTDVRRVDADAIQQVQDAELLLDGGRLDGGRLEAVAQRFVVEENPPRTRVLLLLVPVVDQAIIHGRGASAR